MSDVIDLGDDIEVVVDGDGVHIDRSFDTDGITLSFEQFETLSEWLGYVQWERADTAEEEVRVLGFIVLDMIFDDVHRDSYEATVTVEEWLRYGEEYDIVALETESGNRVIGWLGEEHQHKSDTMYAKRWRLRRSIDVIAGDADSIELSAMHVHEARTRNYPGYNSIEDIGVQIDGEFERVVAAETIS